MYYMDLDYVAQTEQRYRETVEYPRAARRQEYAREVQLMKGVGRGAARRHTPVRWLGHSLAGLGDRLVALGERLAPSATGAGAPQL